MNMYANEISQIPALSAAETEKLYQKMKKGDKQAREKLISCNLNIVFKVVEKQIQNALENNLKVNISPEDLLNIGAIAIIEAVNNYNPRKDESLKKTMIICVNHAVIKAIKKNSQDINNLYNTIPLSNNVLDNRFEPDKVICKNCELNLVYKALNSLNPDEIQFIWSTFYDEDVNISNNIARVIGSETTMYQDYLDYKEKTILKNLRRNENIKQLKQIRYY